jgi:hypothetical protein
MQDENRHIYISETALMELMDYCEPLSDADVDDLIFKTKSTRFN